MSENLPPQYGPPPGDAYPAPRQTEPLAVGALVTSIVGFFICAPIGGIAGLLLANNAKRRIEASGGRLGGSDLANAARIISIIQLALFVIAVVLAAVIAIIAVAASNDSDTALGAVATF